MVRVAINGFGRIGRAVLKAGIDDPDIEFMAINDLTDIKMLAYLLKHDSVYGGYDKDVEAGEDFLKVGDKKIKVLSERDPARLPWRKMNIDVVAECTGFFTHVEDAKKHLEAGAKKVLISAPAKGDCKTIVYGVNENTYDPDKDHIVSNASCTTNCLAPVCKVLNDHLGIERGFLTTTHAYTSDQRLVDGPHKNIRRSRAAAINIVPTTTGAAIAVTKVIPELEGKMDGIALRVPVACGSICDFVCQVKKKTSREEVNDLFRKASKEMKGVLEYSEEEIVSTDVLKNSHSSIVDGKMTHVIGNLAKVFSWYDNEWGFSCRMIDVIKML